MCVTDVRQGPPPYRDNSRVSLSLCQRHLRHLHRTVKRSGRLLPHHHPPPPHRLDHYPRQNQNEAAVNSHNRHIRQMLIPYNKKLLVISGMLTLHQLAGKYQDNTTNRYVTAIRSILRQNNWYDQSMCNYNCLVNTKTILLMRPTDM